MRYTQTLKLARTDQLPFVRQEWETPVDTQAPDLTRLPAEVNASLGELAKDGLAPVFATKIRRHAQRLAFNAAEIEIAFDEGTIEAGEYREPLVEIKLELKTGETPKGGPPDAGGSASSAHRLLIVAEGGTFAGILRICRRGEMAHASPGARTRRVCHHDACALARIHRLLEKPKG